MRYAHSLIAFFTSVLTLLASALVPLGGHAQQSAQVLPQAETGRIERLAHFPSQHVDARHVDCLLYTSPSPRD